RSGGLLRATLPRATRLERQCRTDRPRRGRRAGAALLQRPQDDDLWRLLGSAARHHVQDDAGTLTMDLAFNEEELAFQREARDWSTANMPPEVAKASRRSRTSHVSKERLLQWQKKLAGKGWLCPNWPAEFGGPGWSSTQKFIFEMEMARADSPYLSSFSIKM